MAIRFIRKPSDTPNVSNADDARLLRYALGGYDGYIKGKGAKLSYTINGSTFKINSGVVVLQGYDVEIDANGWELTVDNVATKRYFSVYLEINLATQTADIKSMYDTAGYPTVSSGDDLTASPTGTARMLLYQLTAQNGVISEVSKKVTEIKYSKTLIEEEATARATEDAKKLNKSGHPNNKVLVTNSNGEITTTTATANQVVLGNGTGRSITTSVTSGSSSLVTSGAVAERLNALGFKTGTVTVQNSSYYSSSEIMQQGRVVIGKITFKWPSMNVTSTGSDVITIGTLNTVEPVSGKKLLYRHYDEDRDSTSVISYTCEYYINSRTLSCERSWYKSTYAVSRTFSGGSITVVLAYCPVQNRYYFGPLTE